MKKNAIFSSLWILVAAVGLVGCGEIRYTLEEIHSFPGKPPKPKYDIFGVHESSPLFSGIRPDETRNEAPQEDGVEEPADPESDGAYDPELPLN